MPEIYHVLHLSKDQPVLSATLATLGQLPHQTLAQCFLEITVPPLAIGYWVDYVQYDLIEKISFGDAWTIEGTLLCPRQEIDRNALSAMMMLDFHENVADTCFMTSDKELRRRSRRENVYYISLTKLLKSWIAAIGLQPPLLSNLPCSELTIQLCGIDEVIIEAEKQPFSSNSDTVSYLGGILSLPIDVVNIIVDYYRKLSLDNIIFALCCSFKP